MPARQCKSKWGWGIHVFGHYASSPPVYHLRQAIPRAQNHRGKIPGAGRRVQSGAQPDEASKRLTRRPATHHHASDSRTRHHATADWLRIIRAHLRAALFFDFEYVINLGNQFCKLAKVRHHTVCKFRSPFLGQHIKQILARLRQVTDTAIARTEQDHGLFLNVGKSCF